MAGLVCDEGLNLLLVDLPFDVDALPERIDVLDRRWQRKHELHVTVVSGPTVLGHAQRVLGSRAHALVASAVGRRSGYLGVRWLTACEDLRHVRRGRDETLVLMCRVEGLAALLHELNQELRMELELPPTHVTLYTRGDPIGIGTAQELDERTKALPAPDIRRLRRALAAAGR